MNSQRSFFDGLADLRRILDRYRNQPTALRDRDLRQLLGDPDLRREFFDGLIGPDWLPALREDGYFATPPEPKSSVGGAVQHPRWPEGQYLVRAATDVPEQVVAVFRHVPMKNLSVVGNMLDAALAMPPATATRLLAQIKRAASTGTLWIHFRDASDLCVRLCENDELAAALGLAEVLFSPMPGEKESSLGRRDSYWYKDGLTKVIPVLVNAHPEKAVVAACRWLEAVVDSKGSADPDSGDDGSYWWRPAVEEHEQNHDSDIAGVLVGAVREAAEEAIRRDATLFPRVIEIVSASPYVIFRRIHIHLIGEFANLVPDTARELIMTRELFDDFRYKHEYAVLVGSRLELLSPPERAEWFSWIAGGPDMSDYDEYFRSSNDRDPTEEEREARRDYWRFEKLYCVREHLDEDWQSFYESMSATHGEPELADLNSRVSSGWQGQESPLTLTELSALSFEAAVERIAAWRPTKDSLRGPSLDGLASVFGQLVSASALEASRQARVLEERPPVFVRTFIAQMTAAVRGDQEVDVGAVLSLCEWVVRQPLQDVPEIAVAPGLDLSWQWTRDEVARFLTALLQAKLSAQPTFPWKELRSRIWQVIESLSGDPDKSGIVSDAAEVDPMTHDYLTEAINSPHGRAVEAALEYARWVAHHLRERADSTSAAPEGFDALPEVRDLLVSILNAEPPSPSAHAIIGSRFGVVYWVDKKWLASNAPQLFFLKGIEEEPPVVAGWAAWNAFLVWVRPHVDYYRLLEAEYAYAVQRSATAKGSESARLNPMARLGEHLMVLYGRGDLQLHGDGPPLGEFLRNARPEYRRHALTFVGRVLEREAGLPESFVVRFRELWEEYWRDLGPSDARGDAEALPFGHWLASGRFDPEWGLAQLRAFVREQPLPQPDGLVLKYLAGVASADPGAAMSILEAMAGADHEGWRLGMRPDAVRSVLVAGLEAGGRTEVRARAVIDQLGRRGFTELGTLLERT